MHAGIIGGVATESVDEIGRLGCFKIPMQRCMVAPGCWAVPAATIVVGLVRLP